MPSPLYTVGPLPIVQLVGDDNSGTILSWIRRTVASTNLSLPVVSAPSRSFLLPGTYFLTPLIKARLAGNKLGCPLRLTGYRSLVLRERESGLDTSGPRRGDAHTGR